MVGIARNLTNISDARENKKYTMVYAPFMGDYPNVLILSFELSFCV